MTEETADDQTWLTQEAYDRLTKELEQLSGPGRQEVAERIEAARDEGDLKENGGYHAAREEQGKLEARIRQLETLLRSAKVGEADADTTKVAPGKIVAVDMGGREMRFLLGSREIAGDSDIDVFSEKSPLGAAVNGAKVGDEVEYEAPNGKTMKVTVSKVEAFG
ncbi:transcription elongation factor GreA [Brevibacterium sp. 5221]|uniref:Transcription elongation factor GreA n=1 Tax=Brevibacterium rongguiense TaxID=2695267 RepID=A0A6N9H7V1_9MICO|nr:MULTISPECIES: transcription elongation factor GreA [Brevibacterium]MYM19644.1 transcription elongation factor GreA [Brevibacterium rongguiense]WAL40362.1 transcription elongation factor GreA [Brevibacterium sp. BRM-1]